ncbi:predicted protein [Plenodomus lingam JN3]|uniref:Predicted protein n=1 Tax=Leptosphaeria maculans (strain JN3 / isolate v23.1.3 / race Av1-4-5-6-7-8) TaxID=985895 RepID=E5AA93_LEPMJ|nr:predicted protein [Plenodomus lingam JN3]CBY00584.1 predicted protein [Plenodomus lingam JN3]
MQHMSIFASKRVLCQAAFSRLSKAADLARACHGRSRLCSKTLTLSTNAS